MVSIASYIRPLGGFRITTTEAWDELRPKVSALDFSHDDVERAARYHRPRYIALAVDLVLSVAVLAVLQWLWPGPWHLVDGLGWAGAAAAYAGIVTAIGALVGLPVSFWRGYLQERQWGFSTQGAAGWLVDILKGEAVSLLLMSLFWTGLVGLARWLPSAWPVAAAAALALAVGLLSFVAPVVLEPIFNRFGPLADERLAAELRSLAERAGVPVRDVLVADASRRTTKVNAYVSGLGKTRRVVLYDTLLETADEGELKLIVAHELGHRRARHIVKATAGAMAGAAFWVVLVWALLGSRISSPRFLPLVLLISLGLRLLAAAPVAAVFRGWERVADRCSLELTHDLPAFERTHLHLARKNLGDLAPPRLAYLLLFSHPTAPERLAFGRAWAEG
jgi:STE24 endopeptidase